MGIGRALVVDDSKLARVTLKKQLEAYDLMVDLADSGEEALDFLTHETVDVVFMDHEMPGMDGLTAVKAIKENPKTATIPVMMYTSKEGELYVSQARALGAIDVLPKQTQPGVLYGMLLKLGLVRDRRRKPEVESADTDESGAAPVEADQPPGMHLPSLVARILEDQRDAMRSDLMSSQRSFAQQIASEVYERQRADLDAADADDRGDPYTTPLVMLAGVLAVAAILLTVLLAGTRQELVGVREQLEVLASGIERGGGPAANAGSPAGGGVDPGIVQSASDDELLDALTWALNESGRVGFDQPAFDGLRAAQIGELVARLESEGYEGTILVQSHLGVFCLSVDASGMYRLADPETPLSACALTGHPLDDSSLLADRQNTEFEAMMDGIRNIANASISLELIANDRLNSIPRAAYPDAATLAGEWNRVAAENHRVEYTLFVE